MNNTDSRGVPRGAAGSQISSFMICWFRGGRANPKASSLIKLTAATTVIYEVCFMGVRVRRNAALDKLIGNLHAPEPAVRVYVAAHPKHGRYKCWSRPKFLQGEARLAIIYAKRNFLQVRLTGFVSLKPIAYHSLHRAYTWLNYSHSKPQISS